VTKSVVVRVELRRPGESDRDAYIAAMGSSRALHRPWVDAPATSEAFDELLRRAADDPYLKVGGRWRDHERWAISVEQWRARRA
jgi:hypothetical protein